MSAPMAVCRVDGEPLVSTLLFAQAEFVCVVCGRTYGFLEPAGVESTPEIEARQRELVVQFKAEVAEDESAVVAGGFTDHEDGRRKRAAIAAKWRGRHA